MIELQIYSIHYSSGFSYFHCWKW